MTELLVVKGSDFSKIQFSMEEILRIVEDSIVGIGNGSSVNPPKISIEPVAQSMTIAMLAQVKSTAALGIKAYTEFPLPDGRSATSSTITLFDDLSGALLAFMDCQWITATRTGAVTALFAREAALPGSKVALIVGAGAMARETVRALPKVMPGIEEIIIRAPRRDAVEAFIVEQAEAIGDRKATISTDIAADAGRADIVIGAAGYAARGLVTHAMLKRGATAILLGYGVDADVLHKADRVLATSEPQMHVTGKDLADANGKFPAVDAELSDILLKRKPARTSPDEIVFAYNSGLAVTDVAVAAALYKVARENGIGHLISGF